MHLVSLTIQLNIYTQLNVKKVLFQTILFSISIQFSSIWPIDRTLSVLYFDLWPGQTCHSKVMHRKEVTHSNGTYEEKSRRWTWQQNGTRKKSHDALIDWCTGREWPLNCMTVISAWWRSNMPFQTLSGHWTII